MKLDTHQLAWAAGLFDGEGGTYFDPRPCVVLAVSNTNVALLARLALAVGCLDRVSINGPVLRKKSKWNRKPSWLFRTNKFEHVQAVMAMLWRYLSLEKKAQYKGALQKYMVARVARASVSTSSPQPEGASQW